MKINEYINYIEQKEKNMLNKSDVIAKIDRTTEFNNRIIEFHREFIDKDPVEPFHRNIYTRFLIIGGDFEEASFQITKAIADEDSSKQEYIKNVQEHYFIRSKLHIAKNTLEISEKAEKAKEKASTASLEKILELGILITIFSILVDKSFSFAPSVSFILLLITIMAALFSFFLLFIYTLSKLNFGEKNKESKFNKFISKMKSVVKNVL